MISTKIQQSDNKWEKNKFNSARETYLNSFDFLTKCIE